MDVLSRIDDSYCNKNIVINYNIRNEGKTIFEIVNRSYRSTHGVNEWCLQRHSVHPLSGRMTSRSCRSRLTVG